jgi:hypothetical protein
MHSREATELLAFLQSPAEWTRRPHPETDAAAGRRLWNVPLIAPEPFQTLHLSPLPRRSLAVGSFQLCIV